MFPQWDRDSPVSISLPDPKHLLNYSSDKPDPKWRALLIGFDRAAPVDVVNTEEFKEFIKRTDRVMI